MKVYKPADVAKMLAVSPSTVRAWVQAGELIASNIGSSRRRLIITEDSLKKFLERRQVSGVSRPRRQPTASGNWY